MKQFDETKAKTWSIKVVDADGGCFSMVGTCNEFAPAKIKVEHGLPVAELLGDKVRKPRPPVPKTLVATLPDPAFTVYPQSSDEPSMTVELSVDQLMVFTTCLEQDGIRDRCLKCAGCELNEQIAVKS